MMNSWPSTRASPLERCSRAIQWCISSAVSALHGSTRLAVIMTKELGLRGGNGHDDQKDPADARTPPHLSGLSQAQTESISPTSNVPWKGWGQRSGPERAHARTQTRTHHGVLGVGLLVVHFSDLLFGGAVDLTQHAEPLAVTAAIQRQLALAPKQTGARRPHLASSADSATRW